METQALTAETRQKFLGLQILRFVAAFAVVLFHIGDSYQSEYGNETNFFEVGAHGVDLFFVISGFIIAYTTDETKGAWWFIRRRLARIIPLYWLLTFGIIAIAAISPSLLNSTVVNAETVLKSLFFIPFEKANGLVQPILFLGWSLNYEMFFYAIYAICISLGFRSAFAPAVIILVLVAAGRLIGFENVVLRFYTNQYMLEFVMGIGICFMYRRYTERFHRLLPLLIASFALAIVLREAVPGIPWVMANGIPAAILLAAVLPLALRPTALVGYLVLLGDASYSLYLAHPYIVQALVKAFPGTTGLLPQILLGTVAAVIATAVSIVLYRMIELPAQAWGRTRPSRRSSPAEIVEPAAAGTATKSRSLTP